MTGGQATPVRGSRADHLPRPVSTVQLQFGAVLLVLVLVVALAGAIARPTTLVLGLTAAALATALAMLVPWHRLPRHTAAVVPAIDVVAIGLLYASTPSGGFHLLWALPVIWSAWSFGVVGAAGAIGVVWPVYWVMTASLRDEAGLAFALMFPSVLGLLAGITVVVSRRAQAQRALLERQARALRTATARAHRQESLVTDVLDSVDFGVVAFGLDGSVLITNDAAARLEQVSEEAGDAVYAADGFTQLRDRARLRERARRGESFVSELVWYGKPGSEDRRALQITARQLQDLAGAATGRVMVTREVTEEQLALRARDDLVASVSHELRTPLTSIVGYLDLVEDDEALSPGTRRNLQVAQRNAERLLTIVADVLAVSASSRMGLDLRVEPRQVDLADLVGAAIESAQVRARERAMSIDASGVEHTPAQADPQRIRQVADNLIENAVKYGRDGGRIEVGCAADSVHAWIVVRDDGPGITAREQVRLFDRFYRAQAVRNTSVHGSGLGLAISRDIVRAHGGDLTVTSSPGSGATFVVRLPAAAQGSPT